MGDRPLYPSRGKADFINEGEFDMEMQGGQPIGMFNIPPADYLDQRSPAVNANSNLNYKHTTGMHATQYNNRVRARQNQSETYTHEYTTKMLAQSKMVSDFSKQRMEAYEHPGS